MSLSFSYPKFRSRATKVIVIQEKGFFLDKELQELSLETNVKTWYFNEGRNPLKVLLELIAVFQPDYVLSVNLRGCDQEGELFGIFEKIQLPLAVWFLDNPLYLLKDYKGTFPSQTQFFVWDKSWTIKFQNHTQFPVHFLPLATSKYFQSHSNFNPNGPYSFVGSSMLIGLSQIQKEIESFGIQPKNVLSQFSHKFAKARETDFEELISQYLEIVEKKVSPKLVIILEEFLKYEMTSKFRKKMVESVPNVTLIGDEGWSKLIYNQKINRPLNYYTELPNHFNQAGLHLNFTHLQMPTGMNQRVFDVINSGGVLVTDNQADLLEIFPILESWVYSSIEEIGELTNRILRDQEFPKILQKVQSDIRENHLYYNRLVKMSDWMREFA